MKRLVVGPWTGEFGWEIMSWQGFIRRAAVGYTEVIVCSQTGHEALYADFATHYIPHRITGLSDCWRIRPDDQTVYAATLGHLKAFGGDMLFPSKYIPVHQQKFIRYGHANQMPHYDVIFHARKPVGKCPGKAWPPQHWDDLSIRLRQRGLRCACVGTAAYVPAESIDLTSLKLSEVMDLFAAATMVFGPASGPIPLASLCCTPHLTWADTRVYSAVGDTAKVRIERTWNPFNTVCKVLTCGWQPSVDLLEREIVERFAEWKHLPRTRNLPKSADSGTSVHVSSASATSDT